MNPDDALQNSHKIGCTIGILAYNSIETIPRALESVRDFAEVIVADGGSTDGTIMYAAREGARIIEQSQQGKPITDFALERNRLLSAATQPWFFYLDADEAMSSELRNDIKRITEMTSLDAPRAYRVCYLKSNANISKIYRTFREYYQIRLTRTDIGSRFERAVHERIVPPKGTRIGQIEGAWYVPLDDGDLSLAIFADKAWKRTWVTMSQWKPKGIIDVARKMLIDPIVSIGKSLIKIIGTPLKHGTNAIPLRYELLRILYALMLAVRSWQALATRFLLRARLR